MSPAKKKPVKKYTKNKAFTERRKNSSFSKSTTSPKYSSSRYSSSKKPSGYKPRSYSSPNTATKKIGAEQIEGRRAVLELLIAGTRRTHEIYLMDDLKPAPILEDIETIAESENVPLRKISKAKFFQMAHTETPQGVIAKASPLRPKSLEDLLSYGGKSKPFLLVVDGVVDTANLGSLMRSAECAGVTGIVLGKHRSASITAATTKSAAGAIEYIPIALVTSIPQVLEKLKEENIWTVGLDQDATTSIHDINFAKEPIALIVGAEGGGLKNLTKKRADTLASIPLQGRIGSLNAAVASAIACFEIQRLRQIP